jgi:hypothetical protein
MRHLVPPTPSLYTGKDWEWEGQDGGDDAVGCVYHFEDEGIVHVRITSCQHRFYVLFFIKKNKGKKRIQSNPPLMVVPFKKKSSFHFVLM